MRRGIAIDAGGAFLLPRVMPLAKAKELVFFGDDLTADEAYRLGLVNRVVPADQLEALAREWAERLATGPTYAIGMSKRLLNRSLRLRPRHLPRGGGVRADAGHAVRRHEGRAERLPRAPQAGLPRAVIESH